MPEDKGTCDKGIVQICVGEHCKDNKTCNQETVQDQPSCPDCGAYPLEIGFHEDVYRRAEMKRDEQGNVILEITRKDTDLMEAHYFCLRCNGELPESLTEQIEEWTEY